MNLKDLNENLPINIPTNFHCQFFKSSIYDPNSFPPQSMALKSSKISSNYTPESIYLAMTSSNKMPSNTLENFIDKIPSNNKIENIIDLKPEKF